ncbi:hypothetical protein SELMODRAFT_441749 [Selaginella moellendorffii]|uniref:Glucose/Sorbosone dehydrogenase domain-containing protein n=1 Tax=Selaginella moellendorffii TaxID=88036 RepID=D8RMA8_SELML|nr:HIPL1 protein [Selaginella moellendorffii]EFJ26503.1 hypothetical protein SELMODRAFT_441749 [Selaginella moellendorffii]|eukprot:XP_002972417.1 HIPL1 protein [Selaginella moellendorffii]
MAALLLSSLLPLLLLLLHTASALPLCLNQEAPLRDVGQLRFCSQYSGTGCCSASDDSAIGSQFAAMNISDATCANYIKQVLCSKCDSFAADLFGGRRLRSVPLLCNSSTGPSSGGGYCFDVWDACKNLTIPGSPFSPSLVGTLPPGSSLSENSSANETLIEQWQSNTSFCEALGLPQEVGQFCFDGSTYNFTVEQSDVPPAGVCFDKVGEDNSIGLVPHPDGSNRAFVAMQTGQIYLVLLPDEGSNTSIKVDKAAPFLDISNFIISDREFGLMSVAFHPEFVKNGRFFVSYNCDKQKWAGCGGARCTCNADVGCDPSQVRSSDGTLPCQYSSVISEFSAGNATISPSQALKANPNEVRRILSMGLPYTTHHGGLLLFGPQDKYLYFMMGDGGGIGDPFNFAQNKKSLLGKILRLDIDKTPTDQEVSTLGLWGKYSIPETNPFLRQNDSRPEIWALGLRNPWRCSFDSAKPEYFYCTDVGQSIYEEVNLVTKGGNYGWRTFDGVANYSGPWSPGGNTSLNPLQAIFPVATYLHDSVNKEQGSASIIGGSVSRSLQDPCLYGRYLYADLYGGNIWGITETPEGSGNYTSASLNFSCSGSTLACKYVSGSPLPDIGFVFAWGEDNSRNLYMLTSAGIFKVVNPTKCNFTCTKKLPSSVTAPALTPIPTPPTVQVAAPPPSRAYALAMPSSLLVATLCFWMLFYR